MEGTSPTGTTARLRWRAGSAVRSQAARGSAAAFTAVYERHHRALYRYCRSLLGDDDEARDALQSTMANAFAALRFEERDFELRPWLFRIAHNEAVSRLRQRRDAVDLRVVETLGTDSVAQAVELRERLAQLRADLKELPERQRAALVMRELSGLGHAEIAAVLGGSPQTVKQTIFEARTALLECAEGRGMACAEVQRRLSDGDGRVRRGRRIRAHMRACRACRQFEAALAERPARIAALAPAPPAAAAATWLGRLLAATGTSGAGGPSWLAGGVAGTLATKAAAVVVATATVAGAATVVRDVTARPASASRSRPALARAVGARHAAGRAAQPPLVSPRRASDRRPADGSATTAPAATASVAPAGPSAEQHPATVARGAGAESATKHAHPEHPSGAGPASKHSHPSAARPGARHAAPKAPSPATRAHGERAGGAGRARPAPPGQAKNRQSGHAKPARAGDAKPAHSDHAKLTPSAGAAPATTADGDPAHGPPTAAGDSTVHGSAAGTPPAHAHGTK
jgi:RNA polymerase sigma factor (sigma-70 family)